MALRIAAFLLGLALVMGGAKAGASPLDKTFGRAGFVSVASGGDAAVLAGLVPGPSESVVLAGAGLPYVYDLMRFDARGRRDSSFGMETQDPPPAEDDVPYGLLRLGDGGYVAVGSSYGRPDHWFLARHRADGSLDPAFGNKGVVDTAVPGDTGRGYARTAISQGSTLVVGGLVNAAGEANFALARYRGDGTLDTSFGSNGFALTPVGPAGSGIAKLIPLADGRIVAVGTGSDAQGRSEVTLARYSADGQLDSTFGQGGLAQFVYDAGRLATGEDAVLAPGASGGQELIVAGASEAGPETVGVFSYLNGKFAVARVSVGQTGEPAVTRSEPFAGPSYAHRLAVTPEGKILVAGWFVNDHFALARYSGSALRMDPRFGGGPICIHSAMGDLTADQTGLVLDDRGRATVASAASDSDGYFVLARILRNFTRPGLQCLRAPYVSSRPVKMTAVLGRSGRVRLVARARYEHKVRRGGYLREETAFQTTVYSFGRRRAGRLTVHWRYRLPRDRVRRYGVGFGATLQVLDRRGRVAGSDTADVFAPAQ